MTTHAVRQAVPMDGSLAVQMLEQIPTPLMSVNHDLKVTYMNAAGRQFLGKAWEQIKEQHCYELFCSEHCQTPDCRMRQVIENGKPLTARNKTSLNGKTVHFEYTACPLRDGDGHIVGGLEFIVDITTKVYDEQRLQEQSQTIRKMSTPAIKLWEGILVLPVVGVVDSQRAQQMMETILTKIAETSARIIIMDIQGVAAVDTAVAHHMIKITQATKLMGCECIVSGMSSAVAQSLVRLGIVLDKVRTTATLKDALQEALSQLGHVVQKAK
jgi:rsbT co-antagonist protein RsbR